VTDIVHETLEGNFIHPLPLFTLEKRRLRGLLSITVFQYLQGGYKENGGSLFTRSHKAKTKGNGYKLHQERLHLDIRNKFFTVRINKHLEEPPQGRGRVPIIGGFQDAIGQGTRKSHLGSLSHKTLNR